MLSYQQDRATMDPCICRISRFKTTNADILKSNPKNSVDKYICTETLTLLLSNPIIIFLE